MPTNQVIKSQVKQILLEYPETRKSNNLLVLMVWQKYYPDLELRCNLAKADEVANLETCRRIRQKFNELGIFLPSERIISFREARQKTYAKDLNQMELTI